MYVTKQIQNETLKKKNYRHSRSILKEIIVTCDKVGNSFLTKQEQKQFQNQSKLENTPLLGMPITKSIDSARRFSHNPFSIQKQQKSLYVETTQMKQMKNLKEKMLPKVNKASIDRKFKELNFIKKMGYRTSNRYVQQFKALTHQKDDQSIVKKSWQEFYQTKFQLNQIQQLKIIKSLSPNARNQQSRLSIPRNFKFRLSQKNQFNLTQRIQSNMSTNDNTCNISMNLNHSMQNAALNDICNKIQSNSSHKIQQKISYRIQPNNSNKKQPNNLINETFILPKSGFQTPILHKRISIQNNNRFKQLIRNLASKKKQKGQNIFHHKKATIIQKLGLNKQRLYKQKAYPLYSLIKGGYQHDSTQIEGSQISLKLFHQAKQNFQTLNNCYSLLKQQRYLCQSTDSLNDKSFRTLVFLSQNQHKLPISQFRQYQKSNRIVD